MMAERACADCGATDDLYFHERDGEWACEEVSDCIESQRDQARAEVERLRRWIDNEGRNCPSRATVDAVLDPEGRAR